MAELVPSLLSADFTRLKSSIRTMERLGVRRLHIDVMDGHFVPNLTLGPFIVQAIRRITPLHLETHLMIEKPAQFLEPFVKAGSDTILIHIEVVPDPRELLAQIRRLGIKAGLVINPPTPFETIAPFLSEVDHLLVMTVNPGFGAQTMITAALEKVRLARPLADRYGFPIEVDGGINRKTICLAQDAGTDLLVAGHAIFGQPRPARAYRVLEKMIQGEEHAD
jgi:ribulose-phosphate 3-epimerase